MNGRKIVTVVLASLGTLSVAYGQNGGNVKSDNRGGIVTLIAHQKSVANLMVLKSQGRSIASLEIK